LLNWGEESFWLNWLIHQIDNAHTKILFINFNFFNLTLFQRKSFDKYKDIDYLALKISHFEFFFNNVNDVSDHESWNLTSLLRKDECNHWKKKMNGSFLLNKELEMES
jgi:hypothetical protein